MSNRKTMVAAVAASGIVAASLFAAAPASAMAPMAHKPTICIFLPLCQAPIIPMKTMKPKPKAHHVMHVVKKAPKKKPT